MDNNRIHQITSELKNLRNLISLNLSHNRLIEIPLQILDLQQLENLNLEANIRHSVESDFGKLLTYRERIEFALKQAEIAKKKAEYANQFNGQFLSQMSYELLAPMNRVIGFLNLISKETLTLKQKEYLQRAKNSGQHLMNLIDEILQFSEQEKRQVISQKVVFDLIDTCHQIIEMVIPLSQQKNLDLHFDHSQPILTK